MLHSHHPPSSLFVDLQTCCAGRVLDGAMMASGKLAPECWDNGNNCSEVRKLSEPCTWDMFLESFEILQLFFMSWSVSGVKNRSLSKLFLILAAWAGSPKSFTLYCRDILFNTNCLFYAIVVFGLPVANLHNRASFYTRKMFGVVCIIYWNI